MRSKGFFFFIVIVPLLLSSLACGAGGEYGGDFSYVPPTATPLPTQAEWQLWADGHRPAVPSLEFDAQSESASAQVPLSVRSSGDWVEITGAANMRLASAQEGTFTLGEGVNVLYVRAVSEVCPDDANLRQFGCVQSEARLEKSVLVDTQAPLLRYSTQATSAGLRIWGEVGDVGVGPKELRFFEGFEVRKVNISQGAFDFTVSYQKLGEAFEVRVSDRLGNTVTHSISVAWPARWVLYSAQGDKISHKFGGDFDPFSLGQAGFNALFGWGQGTYWVQYDEAGNAISTVSGTNDRGWLLLGGFGALFFLVITILIFRNILKPVRDIFQTMSGALKQLEGSKTPPALPMADSFDEPVFELEEVSFVFEEFYKRKPSTAAELANFIENAQTVIEKRLRRSKDG